MPKVTIWIREDDYPKWQRIDSKPDVMHGWITEYVETSKESAKQWAGEKVGEYGIVHVQQPIQGDPVYPLDDYHPGELHNVDGETTYTEPEPTA